MVYGDWALEVTLPSSSARLDGIYPVQLHLIGIRYSRDHYSQRAKKVVSDSPGLVDFAIGLVNSVLNLPDGQVKIFRRIKITEVL